LAVFAEDVIGSVFHDVSGWIRKPPSLIRGGLFFFLYTASPGTSFYPLLLALGLMGLERVGFGDNRYGSQTTPYV
jgi:hypothetical protein